VFGVNAPLAVLGLLATRNVPESRDPAAHGHFDVLGAVLGALALAGLTCALIAAGNDPGGTPVAVAGVVGLAAVTRSSSGSGAPPTRCCPWRCSPTGSSPERT
jgi:hypothetical protein